MAPLLQGLLGLVAVVVVAATHQAAAASPIVAGSGADEPSAPRFDVMVAVNIGLAPVGYTSSTDCSASSSSNSVMGTSCTHASFDVGVNASYSIDHTITSSAALVPLVASQASRCDVTTVAARLYTARCFWLQCQAAESACAYGLSIMMQPPCDGAK